MGEKQFEDSGLSTSEALEQLHNDIQCVLDQFLHSQRTRKSKSWVRDALRLNSQHTTINWFSVVVIVWIALFLVISYTVKREAVLLFQAFFIAILTSLSISMELWDNKLRHNEIPRRIKSVLNKIKSERLKVSWVPANYPNLFLPFSPCITLQWTYRDNKLVNLPWALLVKDDIIVVRPGQISPGYCESLEKNAEYPLLHAKEVYGPSLQHANEFFSTPKSRRPLENKKYRLLETPYLNNLRTALEQALDRPVTVQNLQRHFVMIKVIEWAIIPSAVVLIILVNCIKYFYMKDFIQNGDTWLNLFFLTPAATVLPLLPIIFPLVWNILNYIGMARFIAIYDIVSQQERKEHLLEDQDTIHDSSSGVEYHCRKVWSHFVDILKGAEGFMVRSANILHVMGSLTALCCVDKKGILSWPNPTAEKIFFLHNTDNLSQASSLANLGDLNADADSLKGVGSGQNNDSYMTAVPEVLDLTHNQNDPFKLHFDDTGWQKYMNSLKPLGLAVLLNTCSVDTQEIYSKFCSHVTCEAMYNENLIPVTNRRCLCELAKEIGFVDQAQKIFSLEQQLSSYRHLQTEMARRDNKYARSLQLSTKLKFPFPHMFAVIVKELSSGSMQLLSQGTADMVLDSCIDYWDGHDLCPLTSSDRKKIQDFYQRSSLTAYCTAFAYRPVYKKVNEKLCNMYLELPSDSRHLYSTHHSPTPIHGDCRVVLEPRIKTPLGPFFSTDSLLYNDSPLSDISDVDSCFEMQCNQVFIGMVTMQYQAQLDMVHLIEQLERACIRFVHFSKENELRSRVFSEKMGLESGWNCHISLLSERSSTLDSSKALSYSAPSAINLDHTIVKFDTTETEPLTKLTTDSQDIDHTGSQESIQLHGVETHDWQSLSCLTDSTEQSAPVNFDMSNRAKLPRGIDKIRPHIENIDNVPLLVSLFTDCTASSTKEMIRIMQDYGEVICVMGSSANFESMGIFMQADASIAVEPLYPQTCQRIETFKLAENSLSPIDLSRALNSIACSLSIKRENPLSIFQLVIESRHYMRLLWNSVQFWLCSCLAISAMQLVAAILMLPPLLTTGQVLWFCCVVIPLLSFSLMGTSADPEIIKKPQGKKHVGFNSEELTFVLWFYGAKFVPMMFSVMLTFFGTLASYCTDSCLVRNCTCTILYIPNGSNTDEQHTWIDVPSAQNLSVIIVSLHLLSVSIGFVHREYLCYNKSPHSNWLWLGVVMFVLVIQTLFSIYCYTQSARDYEKHTGFQVATTVLVFAFLSPFVTIAINEMVKKQEIKANLRYQRRARLDFGTKLGMNSPF